MKLFNGGDYLRAMERNAMAEVITKVLYPEDNHPEGKSLRLSQQYFLVSATIQDIIHRHLRTYSSLENLPDLVAILKRYPSGADHLRNDADHSG